MLRPFKSTRLGIWITVLGLGCLVIGSSQAMVLARTTTIHLHNKTDKTLYLKKASGKWSPNQNPPAEIKPGVSLSWKSEPGGLGNLKDVEGNVRYSIGNASWHAPFTISPANAVRSKSGLLSLSRYAEQLDTYYIAADGSLQYVWWSAKENKWLPPGSVTPAGATRTDSPIAGVCRASGYIDLFWITAKGEIATRALADNKWSGGERPITGPDVAYRQTDLVAVTSQKNWIDVFWVGKDKAIYSCSWRGAAWQKPVSHTPPNSARDGSSLAAVTRTKDEIHVFYSNKEGAIATVWWRGKWNGPTQITAKSTVADGSSIAAVSMDPKQLAVFWENKEGSLATNYQHNDKDGGKWHEMYPISPAKTARPGSPIAAHNRTSTHMDVFWLSPDGSVMTNYFQSGGVWNKPFAISSPGAARANSSLAAVSRVDHHVDVFWVDAKGTVTTNWWDSKSVDDIYISWTNPLVESQYGNRYIEQAPPGFSLSSKGGQGSQAEAKYVLEKSTPRFVGGFKPATHGFKFSNSYWKTHNIKIPVLFVEFPKPIGRIEFTDSTEGLCGGMCFTVMDYFLANQKLPNYSPAPISESDQMFQYLRQRQLVSWDITGTGPNFFKYMRHDYPDTDEAAGAKAGLYKGRSFVIAKEEWPKIKAEIDANRLVPMGLVETVSYNPIDLGKNHQVLAYGYQLSGSQVSIYYYDPTNPLAEMELRFNIGNLSKRIDILRYKNGGYAVKTINTFFRMPYVPPPSSLKRPQSP